jgi:glycosyltransferase involved in cell wall biosynthesis
MARASISFIVPALNEEQHIEGAVSTIHRAVAEFTNLDFEIVLVNDGSSDSTGEIMNRLASSVSKIKAVHNRSNLGLGGAWKSGVAVAEKDYVMMVVGDNIMPVEDIVSVVKKIGQADIILFHLTNPELRTLGRRIGSAGFVKVINFLFQLRITYYQGLVPRRELLKKITIKTDSYAFPAEVVVKLIKSGHSYTELGISGTPCRKDKSVALQPKRLWKVLLTIFDLFAEIRMYEKSLKEPSRGIKGKSAL